MRRPGLRREHVFRWPAPDPPIPPISSKPKVAAELGVNHETVIAARERLEERGGIRHVENVTDTLGRVQPAHKPPTTSRQFPVPCTFLARKSATLSHALDSQARYPNHAEGPPHNRDAQSGAGRDARSSPSAPSHRIPLAVSTSLTAVAHESGMDLAWSASTRRECFS
jgi:DNA-binding transcriptional MocR family regulator